MGLNNNISDNNIQIRLATQSDLNSITHYIKLFDLDDRALHYTQFVVAEINHQLVGFIRIRKHASCDELCSLAVLESYRKLGIAQALILKKIQLATQPIYLCTIIPAYFTAFGFEISHYFPTEIQDKLQYCTSALTVEEPYVVMTYSKNNNS